MQFSKKENYYPNQTIDSHYQVDDRYNFKQLVLGHKEQMITIYSEAYNCIKKMFTNVINHDEGN